MPLLGMDIGSTISSGWGPVLGSLGFKPRGTVLLAGTHGQNVWLFEPEQLPLLPVLLESPIPLHGGLAAYYWYYRFHYLWRAAVHHERGRSHVVC